MRSAQLRSATSGARLVAGVALAATLTATLAACGGRAPQSDAAEIAAAPAPQPSRAPRVDSSLRIGPDGIGAARAGMTIGALRAALPAGTTLGPPAVYMVDLDGLPVVRGADTLYYVLVPSGDPSGDEARITTLATTNAAFRTAEGIGPGSTLEEAARVYGAATLSYNTDDESREYVAFANYPHANVHFRVRAEPDRGGFAGVYTTDDVSNQTTRYDASARISQIIVIVNARGDG